jgi:hypothetical protein
MGLEEEEERVGCCLLKFYFETLFKHRSVEFVASNSDCKFPGI